MRIVAIVIALAVLGAAGAWVMAGRAEGPRIEITEPDVVGQIGRVAIAVDTPGGALTRLDVHIEQDGATVPFFSLAEAGDAPLTRAGENRVVLERPLGKRHVPELRAGAAKVVVTAARPVLFGYREAESVASREFEVRLAPPQIAVLSRFHYINHGGSELVVYRATPADVESGVRVGDLEYRGFPATGAGIETSDSALRVAFFSLQWDQPVDTRISIYARDAYGNETTAPFDYQVTPKQFRKSTINLDDRFLARVVPAILANSTELDVEDPSDLLAAYLRINRDLRRMNNETIAALAESTAPEILWRGPFKQLINTAVEAGFADQRTYVYNGETVDNQVHLGYDLASTAQAPVFSANRGRVVYAGWLGIYGNCVIIDHGMGLQSLYAHLSSIDVAVGDMVEMEQRIGRTGATGLAGGDHLHFTMLLGGRAVTPLDWWSPKWVEDRILRKLREAGEPG
ncbi:MAG: M23 family metallopeptidase, partial [Gammaproteobacteria bacterium]